MIKNQPKYYYWHEGRQCFVIYRRIKGKTNFFGYYKTEKAVQLAVKLFHKYGWKKENNWRIKHEVKQTLNGEGS